MLRPETVATINTVLTSLPFAAATYVVLRRPDRALTQLYSVLYLAPVLVVVYGVSVPVPGNLYAYFTGAPILLSYGVTDAVVLLYAVGSALAVILTGVNQWADVLYSCSLTATWLLNCLASVRPRTSLVVGAAVTAASNVLVAWYKYLAWPIVPLPAVLPQFLTAVAVVVLMEGGIWWVLTRLKSPEW